MPKTYGGAFDGRTVLVTGHTGFKGAWLSLWLRRLGAKVVGLSIDVPTEPSLFEALRLAELVDDRRGDVRDLDATAALVAQTRPDFLFHLAAQPLVRRSYREPAETFETNVMGTVNVLESLRRLDRACTAVVVTSDKCYENHETGRAYAEGDALGGKDPYSASKGAAEIVAAAYRRSYPELSVSSARAGNVIGGGDWAEDRILPDCVRAWSAGEAVTVRNPKAVRPWQHVLEPLSGYLTLAAKQAKDPKTFADAFNFGPAPEGDVSVGDVVAKAAAAWGGAKAELAAAGAAAPPEAGLLHLDVGKAARAMGWKPRWSVDAALEKTVAWYKASLEKSFDARALCDAQVAEYLR